MYHEETSQDKGILGYQGGEDQGSGQENGCKLTHRVVRNIINAK